MVQMCPVHEWFGFRMVVHRHQMMVYHSKTGHFSPVFKWLTIIFDICGPKPFENWTFLSGFEMSRPFEYRTLQSWVFSCPDVLYKTKLFAI